MNSLLKRFGGLVGPTAVIAAGTMGAGAVASFLLAGAWFGYALLWVIPLLLPVFVISVDSASRVGALNPNEGMFTLIRSRIHPGIAWLILLINVPVHFLVAMGQISVISATFASIFGIPAGGISDASSVNKLVDVGLSILLSAAILWLVFCRDYERMQRVMSLLMVVMFFCFLAVALRSFAEWRGIIAGFVPSIPPDLPVPGSDQPRIATSSIIAMVGAAIAPGALLGMPYLAANAGSDQAELARAFRRAVVNLGFIFGAYAFFVLLAGGFALHSLANHASFADVNQASAVFRNVLPSVLSMLGPQIFSLGLFFAAVTTLVVTAQVTIYFVLDMFGMPWRFCDDNRLYQKLLFAFVLLAAVLAPFWDFPALLKVVLLMGVNVVVIPLIYVVLILLVNNGEVMKQIKAEYWRNGLLVAGLTASVVLAVHKAPLYLSILAAEF